jgi:predicted acylesterase/phospholipase RssA
MSLITNTQTLSDILQVIEKAQLKGKTIDVDDQGRVKRASFWRVLTGGERSIRTDQAAVHVTNRVTAASLRNAIEAAVAVSANDRESGENNPYLRLNRAIHQLHASIGNNELPVQAYRELLQQFGSLPPQQARPVVDLSAVKASDFQDPQQPDMTSGALVNLSLAPAYGQVEGATVKAALMSLGPEGQAIAGQLADIEHLKDSRLIAPQPSDREPALMVMTQQLHGAREALSESIRDAQVEGEAVLEAVLKETWQATDAHLKQLQEPLPALPEGTQTTWSAALQTAPTAVTQASSPVAAPDDLEDSQEFFDALETQDPEPAKPPVQARVAVSAPSFDTAVGEPAGTPWNQRLQGVRDIRCEPVQAAFSNYYEDVFSVESPELFLDNLTPSEINAGYQKAKDTLLTNLQQALSDMQKDHDDFVDHEIEKMVSQLPVSPTRDQQAQALRADGQALMAAQQLHFQTDNISKYGTLADSAPQNKKGLDQGLAREIELQVLYHLASAQNSSREKLVALRDQYVGQPATVTTAQVSVFKDSVSGEEKISLIQPAPALRNLVLAGGGMKAVGVSASLVTFSQAGQFDGVKNIVGNSAGSLTGMVLACGFEMDGLTEFNASVSNQDVVAGPEIDPPSPFQQRYPSMTFVTQGFADQLGLKGRRFNPTLQTDAPRLMVELDRKTAQSVANVLNSTAGQEAIRAVREKIKEGSSKVSADELKKVLRLSEPDFSGGNRELQMVTFKDLEILHRIDPVHFKTLSIVGFRGEESKMETFSAERTPDMPIVYAGRISMAAPLVFTAPVYQGVIYRDGGLGNNFPTDVVHQGKSGAALDQSHAETMLFAYEAFQEAERNLFEHHEGKTAAPVAPGWRAWGMNWLEWAVKRSAGLKDFNEANLGDSNRVWNSGPQTTVVYHGDIDFAQFGASQIRKDFAVAQSRLMATEQVALREQLAYNTVFKDPAKAAQAIPAEQRQAVLDSLPSDSELAKALRAQLVQLIAPVENAAV